MTGKKLKVTVTEVIEKETKADDRAKKGAAGNDLQ
jgi:hypothetical protein